MTRITNQLEEYADHTHPDLDNDLWAQTLLETAQDNFGEGGSKHERADIEKWRLEPLEELRVRRQPREHLAHQQQGGMEPYLGITKSTWIP